MKKIKLPNFSQWKRILKVLDRKEKIAFFILSALVLSSLVFLSFDLYFRNTKVAPAFGGSYKEGMVGQPRFINPIYGETNDVDRDLIELIFSGLMSYDNDGHLVKDLADDYKISEDAKIYEFKLKDNIFWHDGKPLTSEDVVFTIKTIQNPDYKSPLRANWLEVETEIISEKSFRLKLKAPYNSFLENTTLKIIPKHIWEGILPENFALSFYNLQPIGSGPYKFKELRQTDAGFIKSLTLKANQKYYQRSAYISEISFKFFEKKEDLVKAAKKKEIDGFSSIFLNGDASLAKGLIPYSFSAPRYFAVFFNIEKSDILSSKKVRQAMNYATNKQEILEIIGFGFSVVESPILPDFFGSQPASKTYEFNIEKAKTLLDEAGFKAAESGLREKALEKKPAFQFKNTLSTGSQGKEVEELQKCLAKDPEIYQGDITGSFGKATKEAIIRFQKKYLPDLGDRYLGATGKSTRAKLNELCMPAPQNNLMLQFTLTTINQSLLLQAASILKSQWEKVGASIEIKILNLADLKPVIKGRDYDSLLYGEALGMLFDPYSFWHSSQKIDPGLNLSEYENKEADKLLKEGRETLNENERKEKYEKFQDILIEDSPAVFLYSSDYVYLIYNKIKGIETKKVVDPAKRFSNIEDWYLKTRRVWK